MMYLTLALDCGVIPCGARDRTTARRVACRSRRDVFLLPQRSLDARKAAVQDRRTLWRGVRHRRLSIALGSAAAIA